MFNLTKNQRFSHPILGGLLSALLFSFLWRLIGDIATILALVPLLSLGLMSQNLKTLGAAFAVSVLGVALFLGIDHTLNYLLYVALPGLFLPYLALQYQGSKNEKKWYPFERLVGVLALYALASTMILMLVWYTFGMGEKAFDMLSGTLQKAPLEVADNIALLSHYLKLLWPYVPGISMGLFIFMVAIATSLTPKWFALHKVKFPRPLLLLSELYLPWWCWKAFAFVGVGWVIALQFDTSFIPYFFGNLTVPLVALFILQGLSVVVTFAKKQKNTQMFLVIFYGFVVVFGWTLLILILVGLLEPWLDLRARLTQRKEKE